MGNKYWYIAAGFLTLSLLCGVCSCTEKEKVPETTTPSALSTEISTQTSTTSAMISTSATTSTLETTGHVDERFIEDNGEQVSYEDVLNEGGYTEVFASKEAMDLNSFKEVFTKYAYRETSSDISDLSEATTCMTSEDGLDTICLSDYSSENDAHNAVYKYVVTAINAYKHSEQNYQFILLTSEQAPYLWVVHFDMQDSGNRLILYYQTGTAVIRAQMPFDDKKIDTFTRAIQELGFTRIGVSYDQLEISFPDKAVGCTAEQFSNILSEYGYPIEQQVVDERSVYGASKDNSVNWTYEQSQSTESCQTQFSLNFASTLMYASKKEITYYSGKNYEMWIEDSSDTGYKISIRIGDKYIILCGSPDDSAMKEQIRDIIMDACF